MSVENQEGVELNVGNSVTVRQPGIEESKLKVVEKSEPKVIAKVGNVVLTEQEFKLEKTEDS